MCVIFKDRPWFEQIEMASRDRMLNDECGMCNVLHFEALQYAREKQIANPASPDEHFGLNRSSWSIASYKTYLDSAGIDGEIVHQLVLASIERTVNFAEKKRKKAQKFFEIFTSQIWVTNEELRTYIDEDSIYDLMAIVVDNVDETRARINAMKRHEKDPKQLAKQQVRECWEAWKTKPTRYKGKSAFARDMLSKFDDLESSEVIQRWCRDWDAELSQQS